MTPAKTDTRQKRRIGPEAMGPGVNRHGSHRGPPEPYTDPAFTHVVMTVVGDTGSGPGVRLPMTMCATGGSPVGVGGTRVRVETRPGKEVVHVDHGHRPGTGPEMTLAVYPCGRGGARTGTSGRWPIAPPLSPSPVERPSSSPPPNRPVYLPRHPPPSRGALPTRPLTVALPLCRRPFPTSTFSRPDFDPAHVQPVSKSPWYPNPHPPPDRLRPPKRLHDPSPVLVSGATRDRFLGRDPVD